MRSDNLEEMIKQMVFVLRTCLWNNWAL